MAVSMQSTGDYLAKASGAWNYNAGYTAMMWAYPTSFPHLDALLAVNPAGGLPDNSDSLQVQATTGEIFCTCGVGGSYTNSGGTTISVNTWANVAMRRNSTTSLGAVINGVAASSPASGNVTSRSAAADLTVGAPPWITSRFFNGRLAALKIWTAALTDAEILAEMRTVRPLRFTNLWGWWPLFTPSLGKDLTGNGRDLTAAGTPISGDGPPVSWGA